MRRSRSTAGHDASGLLVAGALREADPTRGRAGHGWGPQSGFHAVFALFLMAFGSFSLGKRLPASMRRLDSCFE